MQKLNNTRVFVNEVETQDEKNNSGAANPGYPLFRRQD